jgi:uncharacterized protein YjaG (DUF416 family)
MAGEKLNSIDDYERFLFAIIEAWSPERRVALVAGMAERWLPVYEAFSTREQWGDPANLRRSLEAVWNHLRGRSLSPSDLARYVAQVEESTPHMDDFDDEAALAACVILSEALRCCGTADNVAPAMQAVISGFEAVAPDWEMDPEEQPRLWRQIRVRGEFKKQLKLIEQIEAVTHFDDATIQALRKKLTSKEYIGEVAPAAKATKGPVTITNQMAFEQYRSMMELDLKTNINNWWEKEEYAPGSYMWALMLFAAWMGRYTRRRDTINGGYGQLADVTAQQALVARQRVLDGAETAVPDWGSELHQIIDMALQNAHNNFDVTAFDQPHGYGPSMRRLWIEGQQLDHPDLEAWQHILAWAHHRPTAWEVEDQRKKQGLAHITPGLGALLARELSWDTTGDPEYPWATQVDGERWQIRLNDFPDDFMYSLVIDDRGAGDFHDWPETWRRGQGDPA